MTPEEQKIYDEFESGGRALLDKAKADAAAIGADIEKIIGPLKAEAVKIGKAAASDWGTGWTWIKNAVKSAWSWLLHWLDFLDDPRNGKFSHKRLLALVLVGNGILTMHNLAVPESFFGFLTTIVLVGGQIGAGVLLAIVSAVTKT